MRLQEVNSHGEKLWFFQENGLFMILIQLNKPVFENAYKPRV
jgi:hypothetical protein